MGLQRGKRRSGGGGAEKEHFRQTISFSPPFVFSQSFECEIILQLLSLIVKTRHQRIYSQIREIKKYIYLLISEKKKGKERQNGTLPLSRLMRLQMAHMRRAQCCLSDFCSVSKVTMIDGYFWINKTTFFSLYTCEYIYIYLCVFILKYTRFEKFHWTSSPVITGWERVPPRVSFDLTLSQNFDLLGVTLEHYQVKFHDIITADPIFRTD